MLTDIYLHLAGDALARAVASDERSYRKELFDDCVRLLHKNSIKTNVGDFHSWIFVLPLHVESHLCIVDSIRYMQSVHLLTLCYVTAGLHSSAGGVFPVC